MAKKISKEELDGELFFKLNQSIIEREKERRKLLIDNTKDISEIFIKNLFLVQFENYAGFLGQLEVYYTRSMVKKFTDIRERLVNKFNFDPSDIFEIDITRLHSIAKHSKDKTQAEDLLSKAKIYTSREWRDELNLLKGKPIMQDCPHKMKTYEICADCGFKKHPDEPHS